jgi:hypothetical protein
LKVLVSLFETVRKGCVIVKKSKIIVCLALLVILCLSVYCLSETGVTLNDDAKQRVEWENKGFVVSEPLELVTTSTDIYERLYILDKSQIKGGNLFDFIVGLDEYNLCYLLSSNDGIEIENRNYKNYGCMLNSNAAIRLEDGIYKISDAVQPFQTAYANTTDTVYNFNTMGLLQDIDSLGTYRMNLIYSSDEANPTILGIIFTLESTQA